MFAASRVRRAALRPRSPVLLLFPSSFTLPLLRPPRVLRAVQSPVRLFLAEDGRGQPVPSTPCWVPSPHIESSLVPVLDFARRDLLSRCPASFTPSCLALPFSPCTVFIIRGIACLASTLFTSVFSPAKVNERPLATNPADLRFLLSSVLLLRASPLCLFLQLLLTLNVKLPRQAPSHTVLFHRNACSIH